MPPAQAEDSNLDSDSDLEDGLDAESLVPPDIEHIRCGAHIIQLAMQDGLKKMSGPMAGL